MSKPSRRQKSKPGRNEPCPCGSDTKYKHCCGFLGDGPSPANLANMQQQGAQLLRQHQASEKRRIDQQGEGKPIISLEQHGYRIVAVRNKIHWEKKWKTFHDFLFDYLRIIMNDILSEDEFKRLEEANHPIHQWYVDCCKYQAETVKQPGKISSAPMIGVVSAYMNLAYNLYLIEHNLELQELLVRRLAHPSNFQGACYETEVLAKFIKAGFDISMEDETDPSVSHVEFTATHKKTGKHYSIEAKARVRDKSHTKINRQIYKALKKSAAHERIIFVDLNHPERVTNLDQAKWPAEVMQNIRQSEKEITINGQKPDAAYVCITNNPCLYEPSEVDTGKAFLADGFLIDDFGPGIEYSSVKAAVEAKERHKPIHDLIDAIRKYDSIPSTFDGEVPTLSHSNLQRRLEIGHSYTLPDPNGGEVVGILQDAIVIESKREAMCFFSTPDDRMLTLPQSLTDNELEAYREHPDTFFGVEKKVSTSVKDPVDLFEFFLDGYKNTPKVKLLELIGKNSNVPNLEEKSQEELAKVYSEGVVNFMLKNQKNLDSQKSDT